MTQSTIDEEWFAEPYGEYWNIVTGHGETIAEYIRTERMAYYIIENHHRDLRKRHGFRKSTHFDVQPARVNPTGKQCNAVCPPYRCTQDHGHTGPHYTYGMDAVYVFDTSV